MIDRKLKKSSKRIQNHINSAKYEDELFQAEKQKLASAVSDKEKAKIQNKMDKHNRSINYHMDMATDQLSKEYKKAVGGAYNQEMVKKVRQKVSEKVYKKGAIVVGELEEVKK